MIRRLLTCLVIIACPFALQATTLPAPGEQRDRLLAGEAVLLDTKTDKAGGYAHVQILVQAEARAYWDVIISCELAFAFVEGIQSCEVLEDSGDRAVVHQVVKKGWPIPTQDFTFESLRDPYREIHFRLLEGNLKAMEGTWVFTPTEHGLLVDYDVRIVPGMPAPKFLVRRNIRKNMPELVACIRGLAGGSGSEEALREDLRDCPGETPATR